MRLLTERIDDHLRVVHTDWWPQDWHVQPGPAINCKPLPAAGNRADQAYCVQHTVTEGIAAQALLRLFCFGNEATGPQESLEKRVKS